MDENQTPWDLIKQALERKLSTESFENWIARTQFSRVDGRTIIVNVPDGHTVSFLQEEYSQQIDSLARSLGLGIERVLFHVTGHQDGGSGSRQYGGNSGSGAPPEIESP